MKVSSLIDKLNKARNRYLKKYGCEPNIFEYDRDDGFLFCSKIEKPTPGIRRAKKPYLRVKINMGSVW